MPFNVILRGPGVCIWGCFLMFRRRMLHFSEALYWKLIQIHHVASCRALSQSGFQHEHGACYKSYFQGFHHEWLNHSWCAAAYCTMHIYPSTGQLDNSQTFESSPRCYKMIPMLCNTWGQQYYTIVLQDATQFTLTPLHCWASDLVQLARSLWIGFLNTNKFMLWVVKSSMWNLLGKWDILYIDHCMP